MARGVETERRAARASIFCVYGRVVKDVDDDDDGEMVVVRKKKRNSRETSVDDNSDLFVGCGRARRFRVRPFPAGFRSRRFALFCRNKSSDWIVPWQTAVPLGQ